MKAVRIASLALGILAAASAQTSTSTTFAGQVTEGQLHVRLYNLSNVPPIALRQATTEVRRIFEKTNLEVIWEMGDRDAEEARTTDQSSPVFAPNRQKRDYAVRSYLVVRIGRGMAKGTPSGALGSSLPNARYGVSVTIFHDRIESLCPFAQVDLGVALGHVIAHELGHVLLGSGEHASGGIMRARWGGADFELAVTGRLGFTAPQASAIRDYASRSTAVGDERLSTRLAETGVTTAGLLTNASGR